MAQWLRVLVARAEDLELTWWKERTNSSKASSDLNMCVMSCKKANAYIHKNKLIRKKCVFGEIHAQAVKGVRFVTKTTTLNTAS